MLGQVRSGYVRFSLSLVRSGNCRRVQVNQVS
jgi:hypothetical protein